MIDPMKKTIVLLLLIISVLPLCCCDSDFEFIFPEQWVVYDNDVLELNEYNYSQSCTVYQGLRKINNKEYKYQRVYYVPCEPNTEYSMQCFAKETVFYLASAVQAPESCSEEGSLTSVMSNRVGGKVIDRILTITTGENDKYLIFSFDANNLHVLSSQETIEEEYKLLIKNTVLIKGSALYMCGDRKEIYTHDTNYKEKYTVNALKKARMQSDIEWTPIADMPSMNGNFSAGVTQRGLPYSSVKGYNKFVGVDVLQETFMTCLENPNGILYTYHCNDVAINNYSTVYDSALKKNVCRSDGKIIGRVQQQNASCYYGTVCSSIVGYAIGLPYYETTYSFSNKNMTEISLELEKMRSGDVIIQSRTEGGGGHTVMILDLERNSKGIVKYVTYAESNYSNCHVVKVTADEFVLRFFVESPLNTYTMARAYRYDNFDKNIIAEYTADAFSEKEEKSVLILEEGFDTVGCVFIGNEEYFDYTYDGTSRELILDIPCAEIKDRIIKISRSDMDRSYLTSQEDYNYGNGVICLDRGNKSIYSIYEDIVITIFDAKGVSYVEIEDKEGKTVNLSLQNSVDMKNGTHTLLVKKGELSSGYYTVKALDGEGIVLGFQELVVYGEFSVAILNGYSERGVIIPKDGMVEGRFLSYDEFLTPLYVSRVGVTGVVYDTAPVNSDGSFEISCDDESHTYLKFHYTCNYGRVTTAAYWVYKGTACQ